MCDCGDVSSGVFDELMCDYSDVSSGVLMS